VNFTEQETKLLKDLLNREAELNKEILQDTTNHYSKAEVQEAKDSMQMVGRILLELELK